MRLSNDKIEMETERLLTGKQALPYLEKYFGSLMKRILQECTEETGEDKENDDEKAMIIEYLPDVAIVIGSMSIVVPKNTEERGNNQDDDKLWDDK